jgi:hypothetical protein
MVLNGITMRGSIVGTRLDLKESLEFASAGKVRATVTAEPFENINRHLFNACATPKSRNESSSIAEWAPEKTKAHQSLNLSGFPSRRDFRIAQRRLD